MKTTLKKLPLLLLFLTSCLPEDDLNLPFKLESPRDIGDGTEFISYEEAGFDSAEVESIFRSVQDDEDFWSIRSMLVFKDGKLLAEHYYKDKDDISEPHMIWSCTKQVLGILTGIAIEKGYIGSVDDSISKYLSDELKGHEEKENITIKQLLTMRSGINYDNDGLGGESDQMLRQKPDKTIDFILSLPMTGEPGHQFWYKDGDPHLVAAILQKQIGKPLDEWAEDVLFSKIGIEIIDWDRYRDGITLGGYGIYTTPRELAKFTMLVDNKGMAGETRVVSEEWIQEMTAYQTDTDWGSTFGYYWWHGPAGSTSMNGHGGQYAVVYPDKHLVLVMTAIPNTQGDFQILTEDGIWKLHEFYEVMR